MIRTVLMRGAWLMLGAAIGLAAGLLGATTATTSAGGTDLRAGTGWGLVAVLVVGVGVGLLPGVREIQVTAARTLLGVSAPLLAETHGWRHRWRTCAWTVLQAVTGLSTGVCLFGLLPGAVVVFWFLARGQSDLLTSYGLAQTWWLALLTGLGGLVLAVGGPVLAGALAFRLAPVLLGATPADRLAVAEQRLAAERRHTALARELHDGIGHALSIIGIQAAAARRVVADRPEPAEAALHVIERTSREAQAELDHLLGLLRDPDTAPARAVRADLPTLLAKHRAAGLAIEVRERHGPVPQLVWGAVLDILAEALANAHRHGGAGTVTVTISQAGGILRLQVDSPATAPGPPDASRHSGRGIIGMQERAALLGGTVRAGTTAQGWQVTAALPVPSSPGAAAPPGSAAQRSTTADAPSTEEGTR